ncbi:unnamed protein product [Arctia plantaginis]|uniref:Uncharacterized protein n=1 Tax=Arctia plantaginis TaxID=874455 RepID=A0A8S1BBK4_ARCPL|nr:unnamed protein product [Arctia plantaginis]
MKRTGIITRGRRLCDLVNNTDTQNSISEIPIENNNISLDEIQLNSFRDSTHRNITESPLPISFNESEMNELVNIIDGDIFDNNLEVARDSDTANLETPHPSPSCSVNHLDYDCDNDFCPYYIQKENLSAFNISPQPSPACLSSCSTYTTMNNSPIVLCQIFRIIVLAQAAAVVNQGKIKAMLVHASRKMGPPCHCRKKCYDKLSEEERKKEQWMFVANLVKMQIKRRVYRYSFKT